MRLGIAAVAVIAAFVAVVGGVSHYLWYAWRFCEIELPEPWGSVAVGTRAGSAIFNEPEYCVERRRDDGSVWRHALGFDIQPRGAASVRWYPGTNEGGPFLHLKGGRWVYVVDLGAHAVWGVCVHGGVRYMVAVDSLGNASFTVSLGGTQTNADGSVEKIEGGTVMGVWGDAERFEERIDVSKARYLGLLQPAGEPLVFRPVGK